MKKMMIAILAIAAGVCVFGTSHKADAQPLGGWCCDGYGYRRCTIVNPIPVGNPCFCPGQGYGTVCY